MEYNSNNNKMPFYSQIKRKTNKNHNNFEFFFLIFCIVGVYEKKNIKNGTIKYDLTSKHKEKRIEQELYWQFI